MDDLGLPDFLPSIALLLVHEEDRVGLREGVHIGQVLAGEGELKTLHRLVAVHSVLSELKDSLIDIIALAEFRATDRLEVIVFTHA